jgi:Acetyltransferase (GNAT) family
VDAGKSFGNLERRADFPTHKFVARPFFDYYSTFRGGSGIFLEDIYIGDQFRGKGIGKALFARLASIALLEDRVGIMFNVLEWNRTAIEFYQRIGATFLNDWKTICLEGGALRAIHESGGALAGEPSDARGDSRVRKDSNGIEPGMDRKFETCQRLERRT